MIITAGYSALAALLFVALSIRCLLLRRKFKVALGPSENLSLQRAIRAQANFAEYVPLALLLLFFLEQQTQSPGWIHSLGVLLLLGRLSHGIGVSQLDENFLFRVVGMAATFTVIISSALALLVLTI